MADKPQRQGIGDIRARGLRATASRLAVLELVRAASRPLTHADVASSLGAESWDRATLYRNLNDLADAGLVRRVLLGSAWHFEAASTDPNAQTHPHFVCDECGTVECAPEIQMQLCSPKTSTKAIRQGQVQIELHGRCDACQ